MRPRSPRRRRESRSRPQGSAWSRCLSGGRAEGSSPVSESSTAWCCGTSRGQSREPAQRCSQRQPETDVQTADGSDQLLQSRPGTTIPGSGKGHQDWCSFDRLKRLRKDLIEPVLARYGGRFVDLKGDGAIVEFGSVISAVEAAVEIQRAMQAQDPELPEGERIRYRIGINLGEVIVDGDTIYGDGVNVAARIESLCEPGGVWLSRSVYNQVRGKLDLDLAPSGLHQVKNISEAVETFRVALDGVAPAVPRAAKRAAAARWLPH